MQDRVIDALSQLDAREAAATDRAASEECPAIPEAGGLMASGLKKERGR
jgi:hypothetical protein